LIKHLKRESDRFFFFYLTSRCLLNFAICQKKSICFLDVTFISLFVLHIL
jgi:hypothetical protein